MLQRSTTCLKRATISLVLVLSVLCIVPGYAQLSGNKTIGGASPDFPTIKAAFQALSAQGVTSPGVTFLIRGGTYEEDTLIIRTSTASAGAPIVVKPDVGATVVINVTPPSTTLNAAFKIDSTKYVTFEGSNTGGTSRDMTINALGANGQKGLWFAGNCSYAVVRNLNVNAAKDIATPTSTARCIDFLYLSGAGNDADFVVIENNYTKYAYTGIRIEGVATGDVMESPIVRNNIADSVCNAGVYAHYLNNGLIYGNDVNVRRGSAATMYGIYVGTATFKTRVYNNLIHDMNQLNTTTSITYGIYVSGSSTLAQHMIFNNFVWGLNVPATGTGPVYGMYSGTTNTTVPDTFAFNTVNLSGTGGGIRNSFAFYKGSATGPAIARNNILHNTRADSTANSAAIGKTSAATVLTSNNNNLYVPTTADTMRNVGAIGTVRYKTIANWRTANSSDGSSFTENTPFVSATDLHIQTSVPTQIESGATPVAGITTDIDNQARNASTPDVGADEGSFTLLDLLPPSITHTPLGHTPSTSNRVVAATIVDPSGVATGAGAPRLWYKLSSAPTYTAAVADSAAGSTQYFTLPGQSLGSIVQYYLAAQDLSPANNVGTLPAGGSGINPPGSTPPTTPYSYAVQNPIAAGTYTVGVGGNYPSIDSVFKRLIVDGVAGAVTFTLTDAEYLAQGRPLKNLRPAQPQFAMINGRQEELALPSAYEFDADTIPALTLTGPIYGASAANRITFRPAAGTAVRVLGSGAYVLRLLDASYITFDGINSGGSSLKLQAIAGAGLQIEGNSDNVVVQNMSFSTPSFTAVLTQSASNGIPDSLLLQGNTVAGYSFNGFFGLNLAVGTGVARGYRIMNNDFGTAADSIAQAGIILQNLDGAIVGNNRIRNAYKGSALAGNNLGIGIQTKHLRLKIYNNIIRDIARRSGTAATITSGISVFGASGDTTAAEIYNNMIYGLDNLATSTTGAVRGIYVSTGINDKVAYNTVYLTGTDPVGILTAALFSNVNTPSWWNNIGINARTATGAGRAIAFYRTSTGTPFVSNNNDLYVPTQALSFVGAVGTTNYATLADWQAVGSDSQSVSVMATFRTPDLHIDSTVVSPIGNGGTPVAGITTDIDGQTRHASTPDIGADEFGGPPPAGLLISEDFEGAQFPPVGWSTVVAVGDSGWRLGTLSPLSGLQLAFNRYQTPGMLGSKFLITKRVTLQAGKSYELSAWIRRAFTTAYPPDTVYFKMSTTDSLPASFTTTLYKCYTGLIADTATNPNIYGINYRQFKTTVTGSGTRFFAFDHQDNDGQSIYLDDVKLQEVVVTANDIGVEALSIPTAGANDLPTESIVARGLQGRAEKVHAEKMGIELTPVQISVPSASSSDVAITFKARVRNFGAGVVNSYQVAWSIDGVAQTPVSNTRPLAVGGRDTLTLILASATTGTHRARAWTVLAGDTNPANDSSGVVVFDVLPANVLYEEVFADTLPPTGWKVLNVDGNTGADTSWTFRQVVNFTGGGVVNPQAGRSFWFNNFNSANPSRLINDWLISPRISAADFDSLYFFAGAIDGLYPDSLRVFVSTTGNNVSDFTNQIAYFKVAGPVGTWNKYKFNLSPFDGQNIYIAVNYYMIDGGPAGNSSDNLWVDHFLVSGTATGTGLAGTYTVGTGGAYPTIDSAFSALQSRGVSGAVTFSLTDSVYVANDKPEGSNPSVFVASRAAELDPLDPVSEQNRGNAKGIESTDGVNVVTINLAGPIPGASASNRITLRPATNVRARIVGTGAATFNFSNVSYFTFDGVSTTGSTRLSIENTATNGIAIALMGNSDNNIVQNTTVKALYASGVGVYADTASGAAADSCIVTGNIIPTAQFAVYFRGGNFVGKGNRFTNNVIGTDSVGAVGIYNQQANGSVIANNTIQNVRDAVAAGGNIAGIWIAVKQLNMRVYNNVVNGVSNRTGATGAVFASGIYHFGTTGDTTRSMFYNNMVYGVHNPSTSTAATIRGIYLSTGIQDMSVYNSVNLTGADAAGIISAALYQSSASVGVTLKNNIGINSRVATGTGRAMATYFTAAPSAGSVSNYNDLFVPTQTGSNVAAIGTTNYATLAAWKATGRDSQSVSVAANFQAPHLHINPSVATPLNGGGTPIAGITTDFDGQSRSLTTPDIGADEFSVGYFDNFEAYTAGQRLACQNPVDWTTWSLTPCSTVEDPLISTAFAFSGTKSVVIAQNNDLVKRFGSLTSGIHVITFKFYVPSGKAGYFNTLAGFTPNAFNWGMEAYFDSTGAGRLLAGSATAFPFTFTRNAWQTARLVVNLNIDSAKFSINNTHVRTWRWTLGASGAGSPLRLDANDFFGATAWDQMYVDDYDFHPDTIWTGVKEVPVGTPETFVLMQNYPNPFNPSTTIRYALPEAARVNLSIYNVLGQRVAELTNEVKNAGYHNVVWNGRNEAGSQVATGVYFYRIEAVPSGGGAPFISLKKALLLK